MTKLTIKDFENTKSTEKLVGALHTIVGGTGSEREPINTIPSGTVLADGEG